jgi:hypothetical protein
MKKVIFLFFLLLFSSELIFSQYKVDYGIRAGASNYLGDIGGKADPRKDFIADMHFPSTRWATGVFYRKRRSKKIAWSSTLDYIRIQDEDALTTYFPRRARNLKFKNDMVELAIRGEFTLFYDSDLTNMGYFSPDMKIYVFAGVAGLYSNPRGYINEYAADYIARKEGGSYLDYYGDWVNVRSWRTEGQEKPYSPVTFALPSGIGMYFTYMKKWRFGWEYAWRMTFTDYLDDISTTYPTSSQIKASAGDESNIATGYILYSFDESLFVNGRSVEDGIPQENFYYPGSPRGNSLNNDNYMTLQIYVSKLLKTKSNFYKSKYNWMTSKGRGGSRKGVIKF